MKKALLVILPLCFLGCWAKDTACAVIKTAADVCTYIEYVGEDGKTYRVKLTKEDVEKLAVEKATQEKLPPPKTGVKIEEKTEKPPVTENKQEPKPDPKPESIPVTDGGSNG